ncbi:MAG: hypothetical protein CL849_05565 [Crocinitomicaceae bacterium]|nr:hypothetical protein [Crocinitomicaceae bacterium]
MNNIALSFFLLAAPIALCLSPMKLSAQTESVDDSDVVLASIEAPLTREALNEVRIVLEGNGHMFRYGEFQLRPDGTLIGAEIVVKIEGQEFHDYVEFTSDSCILRIKKTEGPVMEGC